MTAEYADAFPPPQVATGFSLDSRTIPAHSEGLVVQGPWSLPVINDPSPDEQFEDEAALRIAARVLADPGDLVELEEFLSEFGL